VAYEDALVAFRRGDNAGAARISQLDLDEATSGGDVQGSVDALCMLARVALRDGDLSEVESCAQRAHQLAQSAAERRLQRMPLHLRAVAARMAGRFDEGRNLYTQSISLNDELGESAMAAAEHRNLAYLELRAGDIARARELFAVSVIRFQRLDVPAMAPYLTFDQATLAFLGHDYQTAEARLNEAEAQWTEQNALPDPDDAAEIAELKRRLVDDARRAR